MTITIAVFGKLKQGFKYLEAGEADYLKRLQVFCNVTLIELPDEKLSPSFPPQKAMAVEADRLQPYINRADWVVALSETGKQWDSVGLAQQLNQWLVATGQHRPNGGGSAQKPVNRSMGGQRNQATGGILCIVGSAHGLAPTVCQQANVVWGLSKLTLPHPLVRIVVLEQLYRAFKILRNQPYHK